MPDARPARRRKDQELGRNARLAEMPAARTLQGARIAPAAPCPCDGHLSSSPPHDVQTAHPAPPPGREGWLPVDGDPFREAGPGPGHESPHRPLEGGRTAAPRGRADWWAWADLNGRPHAYQACALTS